MGPKNKKKMKGTIYNKVARAVPCFASCLLCLAIGTHMRTTTPAIDTAPHFPQPAGRERDATGEGKGVFPSSARVDIRREYKDRWVGRGWGWLGAWGGKSWFEGG